MARQLAFDLPVRPALAREDFFVSSANAEALAMIDRPDLWPNRKLLVIGPAGAGKSHLAQVFAHDRQALVTDAAGLRAVTSLPGAMVIEDADRVRPEDEEAFFHLHNALASAGSHLLMTARAPARDWPLRLADLQSRVEGTAAVHLHLPDDRLLAAVMLKLFRDRQIAVPPAIIPYLVSRSERSLAAVRDLVAALDHQSLTLGKPIGRTLAAEVLDSLRRP